MSCAQVPGPHYPGGQLEQGLGTQGPRRSGVGVFPKGAVRGPFGGGTWGLEVGEREQKGTPCGVAATWGAGSYRPMVVPVPKPSLLLAGGMSPSGTFRVLVDAWGPGAGPGVGTDNTSAGDT